MNKTQLASKIGNITAMVQIGSVGGALIAFVFCDKIGEPELAVLEFYANAYRRSNLGNS